MLTAWCFEMGCSVWQGWWSGWGWGGTRVQLVENSLSLLGKQWTLDTRRTRAWAEAGSGPTLREGGIVKFSLVWRTIPCMTTPPPQPLHEPIPSYNSYHPFADLVSSTSSIFFFFLECFKANPRHLIFHLQVLPCASLRLRAPPSNPST